MKDKQQPRLHEHLKGAHVVMSSTLDQGVIRSRPMAIQKVEEDNTIWVLPDRIGDSWYNLASLARWLFCL